MINVYISYSIQIHFYSTETAIYSPLSPVLERPPVMENLYTAHPSSSYSRYFPPCISIFLRYCIFVCIHHCISVSLYSCISLISLSPILERPLSNGKPEQRTPPLLLGSALFSFFSFFPFLSFLSSYFLFFLFFLSFFLFPFLSALLCEKTSPRHLITSTCCFTISPHSLKSSHYFALLLPAGQMASKISRWVASILCHWTSIAILSHTVSSASTIT